MKYIFLVYFGFCFITYPYGQSANWENYRDKMIADFGAENYLVKRSLQLRFHN
jgi:hypothetical protein